MRRVRLTYEGAFHHGMNRGINGEDILEGNQNKAFFLDFLEEAVLKYKIRILAYCVIDNHIILQNRSGKLFDFFWHLDKPGDIVDIGFVEELFGSRANFIDFLSLMAGKDLPIIETRFGKILGKEEFLTTAVEHFDRRKNEYGLEMNRKDLGGSTYAEINKILPFDTLKKDSLSKLYLDARARLQKNDEKK